jgi:hypothetical protein
VGSLSKGIKAFYIFTILAKHNWYRTFQPLLALPRDDRSGENRRSILLRHPHQKIFHFWHENFIRYGRPAALTGNGSRPFRPIKNTEASDIVEIPRLTLQDKIAVQLLFLSNFPGVIYEEGLRLAAEKQKNIYGFVLDVVLEKDELLAPMIPYWEDFKLKTIQYYLEKFTGIIGVALKIL